MYRRLTTLMALGVLSVPVVSQGPRLTEMPPLPSGRICVVSWESVGESAPRQPVRLIVWLHHFPYSEVQAWDVDGSMLTAAEVEILVTKPPTEASLVLRELSEKVVVIAPPRYSICDGFRTCHYERRRAEPLLYQGRIDADSGRQSLAPQGAIGFGYAPFGEWDLWRELGARSGDASRETSLSLRLGNILNEVTLVAGRPWLPVGRIRFGRASDDGQMNENGLVNDIEITRAIRDPLLVVSRGKAVHPTNRYAKVNQVMFRWDPIGDREVAVMSQLRRPPLGHEQAAHSIEDAFLAMSDVTRVTREHAAALSEIEAESTRAIPGGLVRSGLLWAGIFLLSIALALRSARALASPGSRASR